MPGVLRHGADPRDPEVPEDVPAMPGHEGGTEVTKTDEIREYLVRHYPCAEVPYGTLALIGERFGVSREWVRQVAAKLNYVQSHPYRQKLICLDCGGAKRDTAERCRACLSASRWLTLTCDNPACGKEFKKRLSLVKRDTAVGSKGRTTQDACCSRACAGVLMSDKMRAVRAVKKWGTRRAEVAL